MGSTIRPQGVGGLVRSPIQAVVHGFSWVGEKIGMVVTPILLAFFYVTVIAAASLVSRLAGADMLHRKAAGNPTFWFDKPEEPKDKNRYLAQF